MTRSAGCRAAAKARPSVPPAAPRTPGPAPERLAYCQFAAPREHARHAQACDVHARDAQDQCACCHQEFHGLARLSEHFGRERFDARPRFAVRIREAPREVVHDPIQIFLRRLEGHARPEARDHVREVPVPEGAGLQVQAERSPQRDRFTLERRAVRAAHVLKSRGQHTDDGPILAIETDRLAQDLRIAPEARAPQLVAQDHDASGT